MNEIDSVRRRLGIERGKLSLYMPSTPTDVTATSCVATPRRNGGRAVFACWRSTGYRFVSRGNVKNNKKIVVTHIGKGYR